VPNPVLTYIGRHDWVDSPGLAAVSIGVPALDRIVVLVAGLRRSATPSRLFTSFTVNGVQATILGQVGPSNTNVTACIAAVHLPASGYATIEIEANGVYTEGSLDIYTLTGVEKNVYDIASHSVDVGNALLNLDVPDQGVIISCASMTGPATDPVSWSGLASKGSDAQNGASFRFSSAYQSNFTAQSRAVSINNLADREALVAVSWGVSAAGGPGLNLAAFQTLSLPVQVMSIAHPRQFTHTRTLFVPYQSSTAINAPPRKFRQPPKQTPFNSVPLPTGNLSGNTVSIAATKDVVEKLIGTRGDGTKKAVLQEDLDSPQFLAQHGNPIGMTVLIPISMPLPASWKETTLTSPTAGLRYIQKL
jgi:hypothetical protein